MLHNVDMCRQICRRTADVDRPSTVVVDDADVAIVMMVVVVMVSE